MNEIAKMYNERLGTVEDISNVVMFSKFKKYIYGWSEHNNRWRLYMYLIFI